MLQFMGVPMGSDSAIFVTNLFQFYYEDRRIEKLKRNDVVIAWGFGFKFRFIDDLTAVIDGGKSEKATSENWNRN